jgi:hypothetical protein
MDDDDLVERQREQVKISFGGSKKYAGLTHMVCDEAGCTHTSEPKIHQ